MLKFFGLQISKWTLLLLLGDICLYTFSVLIAIYLDPKYLKYLDLDHLTLPWETLVSRKASFLLVGSTYLLVLFIAGAYDSQQDFTRPQNILRVFFTGWIGTLVVIIIYYFPLGAVVGRTTLIIQAVWFSVLITGWRYAFSAVSLSQRLEKRLLVAGAGNSGRRLLAVIRERSRSGFGPVGFVDDDPDKAGAIIDGLPVLGNSAQLPGLIRQHNINLVVVAITHQRSPELVNTLIRVGWSGCQVMDMPSLFEFIAGRLPLDHITDGWLLLNSLNKHRLYDRFLKRAVDLVFSVITLTVTWPLFVITALAIKLDGPGPVFYLQERLGQEGRPFNIIKFRTMVQDAESDGPRFSSKADPRITRVGRILRKMRLDELPQFINVLKGEMSLIGPRPEREVFIREFQELVPRRRLGWRASDQPGEVIQSGYIERLPYYSYRLLAKPGLTGWAQVMYPYASSLEASRKKLTYDLYYIKNMGFLLDLVIILKTVRIVLFGRGV